jgi:release factor glutamine methyltransferase
VDAPAETDGLVSRLRAAGSVFAEEEASLLRDRARDADHLEQMASRRVSGEMLEHVVGEVEFCGLHLTIAPSCFVPRRRTRLLGRLAVAAACAAARRTGHDPVLLELCAGTAPVASLCGARVPGIALHAADVDPVPLECARQNLPTGARLHVGDLFGALPSGLRGRFDVIAAVPPYVPDAAVRLLPREAREHEPSRALRGGPDGLDPSRRILADAPQWLAPGGRILLEMHVDQARTLIREAAASWEARAALRAHPGADGRTAVCDVTFSPAGT